MEPPWFGVTMEEGKYSIISINTYEDLELAKEECRKVNSLIDERRILEKKKQ